MRVPRRSKSSPSAPASRRASACRREWRLPAVLQAKLDAAHIAAHIINAGVSGDTSADGLSRIDWSLADHPDAAMVELGSNDALRGIDPVQTEQNISSVLEKLTALSARAAARHEGTAQSWARIRHRLRCYLSAACRTLSRHPLSFRARRRSARSEAQPGGRHSSNPAGVKVIAARLFPYVQQLIAETRAQKGAR